MIMKRLMVMKKLDFHFWRAKIEISTLNVVTVTSRRSLENS
jgi:hypothetical protein